MSLLKKFTIGEWNIGISNTDFIKEFAKIKQGEALHIPVKWMRHRKSLSFFADPFIYQTADDVVNILAEEFIFPKNKGLISLCTIDRKTGRLVKRAIVLEENCHLSYPFYDESTHRFYPESFRNSNWASYSFDGEKTDDKQIAADFPVIDATPVEWNGKYYLFATNQPKALSQLLIYIADSLNGPFKAHRQNPVKDCIATSRPGGKCFVHEGQLFRIVQDSTMRYGEALHIMRVTNLTPDEFSEEFYCDITLDNPNPYNLGVHTLNFKDDVIIVDGYRERIRPFLAVYIYKVLPLLRKLGLYK